MRAQRNQWPIESRQGIERILINYLSSSVQGNESALHSWSVSHTSTYRLHKRPSGKKLRRISVLCRKSVETREKRVERRREAWERGTSGEQRQRCPGRDSTRTPFTKLVLDCVMLLLECNFSEFGITGSRESNLSIITTIPWISARAEPLPKFIPNTVLQWKKVLQCKKSNYNYNLINKIS